MLWGPNVEIMHYTQRYFAEYGLQTYLEHKVQLVSETLLLTGNSTSELWMFNILLMIITIIRTERAVKDTLFSCHHVMYGWVYSIKICHVSFRLILD